MEYVHSSSRSCATMLAFLCRSFSSLPADNSDDAWRCTGAAASVPRLEPSGRSRRRGRSGPVAVGGLATPLELTCRTTNDATHTTASAWYGTGQHIAVARPGRTIEVVSSGGQPNVIPEMEFLLSCSAKSSSNPGLRDVVVSPCTATRRC